MDSQTQELFENIIGKDPSSLTEGDKEFIRARSSYLNEEQEVKFKDVLSEKPAKEDSEEGEDEPKKKSSKK